MQYNNIRSFHWTACLGSILAASKHLNIVPSAVSAQISQLEKRHGIQLFYRSGNALKLTPLGMSLKNETDELFGSVERVENLLGKLKNRQSKIFNIGIESHELALEIFAHNEKLPTQFLMRFFEFSHDRIVQMFKNHKIDILIANNSDKISSDIKKNFKKYWLRRCRLCIISNPELCKLDNPLASNEDLVKLLKEYHIISRVTGSLTRSLQQKIYQRLGMKENNYSEISSRETFVRFIENKLGIGFMICDGMQKMNNLNYISLPQNELIADILSIDQYLYYMSELEEHEIINFLKSLRADHLDQTQICG